MHCTSFLPSIGSAPKIVVLGSMPGVQSLTQHEYYAHPRNMFWTIVSAITHCPATAPYQNRLAALHAKHIGLWDVVASCTRAGSLDSAIENIVVNPIDILLQQHPTIEKLCFNGQKSAQVFAKHFPMWKHTQLVVLPSTSPANASIAVHTKMDLWQRALLPG